MRPFYLLALVTWISSFAISQIPPGESNTNLVVQTSHSGPLIQVAVDPIGHFAASLDTNNFVKIWDLASNREVWSISGLTFVKALAFDSRGNALAIADTAGRILLVDVRTGARHLIYSPCENLVEFAFLPDGHEIICITSSGQIGRTDIAKPTRLNLETPQNTDAAPLAGSEVISMAVSSDGRFLSLGREDGKVVLVELTTDKIKTVTQMPKDSVAGALGFDFSGHSIAVSMKKMSAGPDPGEVAVMNLSTGRILLDTVGTAMYGLIKTVAMSRNASYIAISCLLPGLKVRNSIVHLDATGNAQLMDTSGLAAFGPIAINTSGKIVIGDVLDHIVSSDVISKHLNTIETSQVETVDYLQFLLGGQYLVASSVRHTSLWNFNNGTKTPLDTSREGTLKYLTDGKALVYFGDDNYIHRKDMTARQDVRVGASPRDSGGLTMGPGEPRSCGRSPWTTRK